MGLPTSSEVKVEYRQQRLRRWQVAGVLVSFAVLIGVLAVFGVAYARQSDRVEELQSQNDSILADHEAIGEKFAAQSERFAQESRKLEDALRSTYGQGFRAGQEAMRLPAALRPLARYAAAGFLVPRRLPPGSGERGPRLEKDLDGYAIHWRRLAVFGSRREPLRDWTRQALGGRQRLQVGSHRVLRLTGPSGAIYAWRTGGATYAVLAVPEREPAARALIASMR
jgi:hypothetical protein